MYKMDHMPVNRHQFQQKKILNPLFVNNVIEQSTWQMRKSVKNKKSLLLGCDNNQQTERGMNLTLQQAFKPLLSLSVYLISWDTGPVPELSHHLNCKWWFAVKICGPWWRHQIETFSALLTICAGNSPVTGEFPTQRPVTRSFDVFIDLRLNKRLSKQCWGWWFETLSRPLWRHHNAMYDIKWHSRCHHVYNRKPTSCRECT